MEKKKIVAIQINKDKYDPRYAIMDVETGEILDDAQGYGYKSASNAYSAYAYKTRDKTKDKEKKARINQIKQFLKEHKGMVSDIEYLEFDYIKNNEKFGAKDMKEYLKDNNIETEFSPSEILKVIRKCY